MSMDILSVIQSNMGTFSKGQKLIANFILESYDKAAFMTASRLGKTVKVSESTVVRFAAELGYDGYPAMQKALQEMIRSKLTSIQRIEVSNNRIGDHDILSMVMQSDIEKIHMTMEETDREEFCQAVDAIVSARHIYILGVRSASALASFLGFYLNLILDQVHCIQTNNISEIFEQMIHIGPEDVIIGISFPRYSMRTLKAIEFANNRNAKVITLTDSIHSPMNLYSSCNLIAKSDMAAIVDSLVAPLSVINALLVALCMKKQDQVVKRLTDLEQIWDEYQVYNHDEIDPMEDSVRYGFGKAQRERTETEE